MEYEHSFDDIEGFGGIEKTAITIGVIKPDLPVFCYRPLWDPNAPYPGREFIRKELETIKEGSEEIKKIHKKYNP